MKLGFIKNVSRFWQQISNKAVRPGGEVPLEDLLKGTEMCSKELVDKYTKGKDCWEIQLPDVGEVAPMPPVKPPREE